MFQHILVPLDGSSRSEEALPVAARIARSTGGSLLLVQVVTSPLDYDGVWATVPVVNQQLIDEDMKNATTYLQALAVSPELAGLKVRTEVLFGLPVQHLLAFAETPGIDLIVLCTHGRTGFTRWVLGSVAHVLVHECTRPILVLRQHETPTSLAAMDGTGPFRTLVPLDGSPLAEAALLPAAHLTAALAATGQGTLHLSQVVKLYPIPTAADKGFVNRLNEETSQHAWSYLTQAEEQLSSEGKELQLALTHTVELAPDVASALLNEAEDGRVRKTSDDTQESYPYDLIAISTHGRAGLERWVMGSVTERLLDTSKLPMLIVRPSKEA
jgi:nucleotide-binding universal stress UspA family protein